VLRRRRERPLPQLDQVLERAHRIRASSGEREVQRRAERVEIGTPVDLLAVHDLGRRHGRSAHRELRRAHRGHGAEVDQLGRPIAGAAHVARAEIAVDHAPRMHERERRADVPRHGAGFAPRKRRALEQVTAVEQLHRVIRKLGVVAVVVHRDDARVSQLRQRMELALEQLAAALLRVVLFAGAQLLERHDVAGERIERAVHDRHAAAADHLLQLVATTDGALGRTARSAIWSFLFHRGRIHTISQ
jgi:hypothetical protein